MTAEKTQRGRIIWWALVAVLMLEAVGAMWVRAPWLVVDSSDYLRMAAGDPVIGQLRAPGYPMFLVMLQAMGLNLAAIVAV